MKKLIIMIISLTCFISCATTGIQKIDKEAPIIIDINADKEIIYQTTAQKLTEYGFEIVSSDPTLGRITTNYADFKVGILASAFLASLSGIEDFKLSITTLIRVDTLASFLTLRGIGEYKEGGLFNKKTKHQPVRIDTKAYKQIEKMGLEIKQESEKCQNAARKNYPN